MRAHILVWSGCAWCEAACMQFGRTVWPLRRNREIAERVRVCVAKAERNVDQAVVGLTRACVRELFKSCNSI